MDADGHEAILYRAVWTVVDVHGRRLEIYGSEGWGFEFLRACRPTKPATGSCAVRIEPRSACSTATSAPSPRSTQKATAWRFVSIVTPKPGTCPPYLEDGHVDYGYALTGHKAQGVTTDRTFTVVDDGTDRE
jgi:hypothetical protein